MTDTDNRALLQAALIEARARGLLGESVALYDAILAAIGDCIRPDGSGDIERFARRVNKALTDFAPHARDIRALMAETQDKTDPLQ